MARLSGKALYVIWILLLLVTGTVQATADEISVSTPAVEAPKGHGLIRAYEHILSFDTHARFDADGSMEMRENIKVLSLGKQISRGIFRTLPLTWNRQDGKFFSVEYQIKNVLRDGVAEPFSVTKEGETLMVRIGRADHILKPGIYNYVIQYQVSNHFSRFPDWDELYWNVTGNGWEYPISKASFHLELPASEAFLNSEGKDTRLSTIDVYTGRLGEKEQNAKILADGSVQTSQPLKQGEGLTVAYTWPRTILANAPAPETSSLLVYLLLPTVQTSVLWIPILLLIGYYLLWWRKNVTAIGLKMPPIVPLYALPAMLSPGYLRYVTQRKYDAIAFSSDLLNLVAQRSVAIKTKKSKNKSPWVLNGRDEQWLSLQSDGNQLDIHDKQLLHTLFSSNRKNINLSKPHQRPMQKALKFLEKRCEDQQEKLFSQWLGPIWRGIFIMLLVPVICGLLFNTGIAFITIPVLLLLLLGINLLSLPLKFLFSPKQVLDSRGFLSVCFALLFGLLALLPVGLFIFNLPPLTQLPAGYLGALLVAILLCVTFTWMVPRYTQRGLNHLAIARGLKLYLGTAERHRYQALYPPDKLVAHFESMLPVALALGVGKTWANSFAQYLVSTGTLSVVFANADWSSVNHFSQSCSSSATATPSRSSDSSSSSSSSGSGSSGGGSSGGGSGGGGGGGW